MDRVIVRSFRVSWPMVSRSYRRKTISTQSPTTRPQCGHRSPALTVLLFSSAIHTAALSSQRPVPTSGWQHSSSAFAPEDGATTLVEQNKYPPTPIFQHIEVVDGRIWLRPTGVPEVDGDLPEAEQQLVWSTQ